MTEDELREQIEARCRQVCPACAAGNMPVEMRDGFWHVPNDSRIRVKCAGSAIRETEPRE